MLTEQHKTLEGGIECIEISDSQALSTEPLVSIAMITYGHGRYIAEAIEGVLAQETDFPIELVIGEDCSPDDTMAVVRSYAEKRPDVIRVVTSSANVGTRANGLRVHGLCRGKYIAYCEGDDYWHDPRKLQKQVDILEAEPGCVLVYTDIDMLFQERQRRVERLQSRQGYRFEPDHSPEERFERVLCNQDVIYTPTACMRYDTLQEILHSDDHVFRGSYFPMGDIPRWLELARRGAFRYIAQSTATFRRLAESSSRSKSMAHLAGFTLKSLEVRRYFASKYEHDSPAFRREMRRMGLAGLRRACLAGDVDLIRRLREQLPPLPIAQKLVYFCAERRSCRGLYRLIDRWAIQLRRVYRKWRYGIESSV